VQLVRAGFRDECDDAAGRVAILSLEAVSINGEFRDRFERRGIGGDPTHAERAGGVDRYTIERACVACRLTAAQGEAIVAANVLGLWCKLRKVEQAAQRATDDQRQLIDQLVRDRGARFGIFGLQRDRGCLNLDSLLRCAYFERHIGADIG
jgi:hypothetical protein